MTRVFSLIAVLLTGIFVYLLPGLAEWTFIGNHLSPWFSCVIFGDLVGCVILFLRGYRRSAMAIYILCSAAETLLLASGMLTPGQLVWVTNLVPAVVVAVTLIRTGRQNLEKLQTN